MSLPETTIERLSLYRRVLLNYRFIDQPYIFSHDLARAIQVKPVQVRKDIMLLGFTGSTNNGYSVVKLIKQIDKKLKFKDVQKIALVGISTIGGATEIYLETDDKAFDISACFLMYEDTRSVKMTYPVYSIDKIPEIVKKEEITLAVLGMPPEYAQNICDILVMSGIKGILNLSSTILNVPEGVLVNDFDVITYLEKMAYLTRIKPKKTSKK